MNLDLLGYSLDEQIFFGVITLYLYECTGKFIYYEKKDAVKEEINDENIEKILINMKSLSYINKIYANIYLPCIPETHIKLLNTNKKSENNNKFPFMNPLIKYNLSLLSKAKSLKIWINI